MPKSPDERIELMEKKINRYFILVILMGVLLLITQRARIVGWLDSMEGWMGHVASARG